ncbi:MAG: hypothetical protein ACK4RK_09165 [Gemmataceae bacterium]
MEACLSVVLWQFALCLALLPGAGPPPPQMRPPPIPNPPPPLPQPPLCHTFLGPRVPLFMEDQYRGLHSLAEMEGDVVVILYAYPERVQECCLLAKRVYLNYHPDVLRLPPEQAKAAPVRPLPCVPPGARSPDVRAIVVAVIGKVTPPFRGPFRRQMNRLSPDMPVWLDYSDTMRLHFGIQPYMPNLVVFDTFGRLRYKSNGSLFEPQFEDLLKAIDTLRAEALPDPEPAPFPPPPFPPPSTDDDPAIGQDLFELPPSRFVE